MLAAVLHEIKFKTLTYPFYTHGDRDKIDKESKEKIEPVVKWLREKKYLMGDEICYVDFQFLEICMLVDFVTNGRVWTDYPTLKPYVDRMKAVP